MKIPPPPIELTKRGRFGMIVKPGDRLTILTPQDQKVTGKVTIVCPHHAVLNAGGQHGRPVIADANNTIRIKSGGKVLYSAE